MIDINLLKKNGLQTAHTEIDLPKKETNEPGSTVNEELSADSVQKLKELEQEVHQQTDKAPKKNKGTIGKTIFFFATSVVIAALIIYLYNFTNIVERITSKITTRQSRTVVSSNENIVDNNEENSKGLRVSPAISQMINNNSFQPDIVSGILELIPPQAKIHDFSIKNEKLSLICLVNDIVSGENLKFYIYNHKNKFRPELFYIEKSGEDIQYQITGLAEIITQPKSDEEPIYHTDRQLSGVLKNSAESAGLLMEPLTITKRDQQIPRTAYIYVSGSKEQLVKFCRSLSTRRLNISFDQLEISHQNEKSELEQLDMEIEITIYPQN